MGKIKSIFLSLIIFLVNSVNVASVNTFADTIAENTYYGTQDAVATISNLRFNDIAGHWAREAIIKAGAFNMVKGYDRNYNPNNTVSNQEALAFVLRLIDLEDEAQEEGQRLQAQANNNSILSIWSIGYLSLARKIGLITNEQYEQATNQNQDTLPEEAFKRDGNATREQVASWIVAAIDYMSIIPLSSNEQQSIYNYSDWKNISAEHINAVEICLDNGIMKGFEDGRFSPKGSLTRAEMAQVLSSLDKIYNEIYGYTKKVGTISEISDTQTSQTGSSSLERSIFVKTADGSTDILKYYTTSPQTVTKDAVVYNISTLTGLTGLAEGSQIEYIVDDDNNIVKYVSVKSATIEAKEIFGRLDKIDFETGVVQITDTKDKVFNYYTLDSIVNNLSSENFVYIDGKVVTEQNIPFGEYVTLKLENNLVTSITYVGNATLSTEIRGVVIENNPQFGYLTILDNNGNEITKNYFEDDIIVEKQPYYESDDTIGYLDQMFPNFQYDPRDTTIDQIEAGDIVFITIKEDDPNQIKAISAATNYIMRYGKVTQIVKNANTSEILIQLTSGQNVSYTIPNTIFISKAGKPVSVSELVAGDWVKLLVNEAILFAGETIDSVKEIIIEESGHLIREIIKGEIGTIDSIQMEISITNSYTLGKSGWEDFKQVRKLSVSNSNIEYYYNGQQVSLSYVEKYLRRSDGQVYVALEDNYSGDVVCKITFRTGRDDILQPDTIVSSNNMGNFTLSGYGNLQADAGTIVRKNGNLINANSISVGDYARVSLNGDGTVAIVDIYDEPISNGISIARARVSSIDEGRSFTVESMSQLIDNKWVYTPVSRTFTIDGNTVYITADGVKNINEFIGFTLNSKIGQAFTIIYDGGKATHIIEMDYPTELVSGTVYSNSESILLQNGKYFNSKGAWEAVGIKDSSIYLVTGQNTIVIKGDSVVSSATIKKGDVVRVLTASLPSKIEGGMTIYAQIIIIEN